MNTSHPSALPPATKLFLDALQAGGKLQSPTGPTVLAQAGAQLGVNPQMDAPAEALPEEQQGIASILNQAQQAGPTIANNQAVQQQQQLVDQAANKAAPAAAQMLQQKPQDLATSGLAALPSHIQEFKEGGVIGYGGPEGSYVDPYSLYLSSLRPSQDASSNMAERPAPEEATSEIGDFFRGITELARRANKLRQQRDEATPSMFTALTPTERAQKAATLQGVESQIATLYDPAEDAARAMTAPISPSKVNAKKTVSSTGAKTSPSAKTITKPPAASADGTSSKVSASTREKIGGPTEPEKSGIAAVAEPSVQPIDMTESQRVYNLRRKLVENKPDFESRGLADIDAMQKRDKDTEAYRRYAAIAGARRPGINAGASMMAAAGAFVEAQNAKANAADGARTALGKAAYAESIGDLEGLAKEQDNFNKYKEAFQRADEHLQATIYATKMGSNTSLEVANMRAEMSERIADMRVASALNGRTANLKDPSYVADKISDNVSKQMEELQKNPRLGINIKTAADWINLRRQLTADEVVFWKGRGADVSGVNIGSAGQTATPATGKLDFANIGK